EVEDKVIASGKTLFVDVDASDADGDSLSYSCNRTDLFSDFDGSSGEGSWTPEDTGVYFVDFGVSDGYGGVDNETVNITVVEPDTTPPPSITNLRATDITQNYIKWTWDNPGGDFSHVTVYIDGSWESNTSRDYFNASFPPGTSHTISTRTVDGSGNVNQTWVNNTAKTKTVTEIYVDVKPGSCKNPINLNSQGGYTVAILGSEDFDVTSIDVSSIRLRHEGTEVAPADYTFEDSAHPVEGEEECEYNDKGDGYTDLILKFDTPGMAQNLHLYEKKGETVPISVTGSLKAGGLLKGNDSIWVLNTPTGKNIKVRDRDTETNFNQVTKEGNTTFKSQKTNPKLSSPSGYKFKGYFKDVTTTADYDTLEVCINYTGKLDGPEKNLKLLHYGSKWEDVTVTVDTKNNTICGEVDHLSWFGVASYSSVTVGGVVEPVNALDIMVPYIVGSLVMVVAGTGVGVYASMRKLK
ncbi:MAG: hypothetical protein R6U44_07165, partial [Archaeoglobaceae archaeon]